MGTQFLLHTYWLNKTTGEQSLALFLQSSLGDLLWQTPFRYLPSPGDPYPRDLPDRPAWAPWEYSPSLALAGELTPSTGKAHPKAELGQLASLLREPGNLRARLVEECVFGRRTPGPHPAERGRCRETDTKHRLDSCWLPGPQPSPPALGSWPESVPVIWEWTQRIPKDSTDLQEFRRILVSTTRNFCEITQIPRCSSYCGNLISEVSFFSFLPISSPPFLPWVITTSVPKHNQRPRQREILPETVALGTLESSWSPGQLLTLLPSHAPENLQSAGLRCMRRNNLNYSSYILSHITKSVLEVPKFKFSHCHNSVLITTATLLTLLNRSTCPIKWKEYWSLRCRVI